ncbi:flagellar type III secretion system pore protein FliP [Blastopirellula marina]|uniref:flagellar type III secretion system pore protein FliP n=1 Tax=Blastopirellula marina TaxID=124 RepID=UPI002691A8FF
MILATNKSRTILLALTCLAISTSTALAQMSTTQVSTLADPQIDFAVESSLDAPVSEEASDLADFVKGGPEQWTSPGGLVSTIQIMLLLTVLSLAPAILLMTTGFIRIIVVLGLLRQALGTQQLPPSQVVTAIALFMTILLMFPTWQQVYDESVGPYTRQEINPETGEQYKLFAVVDPTTGELGPDEAWEKGTKPIRHFMSKQIDIAGNSDDVWMFYEFLPQATKDEIGEPQSYDDVPLQALIPAFILSELKTAFLIGFQIYLPFLILDIVVASVTISMGMMMLPPVMISLPFKLLLFVLVDGWTLVVGMLLQSFAPTI